MVPYAVAAAANKVAVAGWNVRIGTDAYMPWMDNNTIKTANNNTRAMQRPTQAGAPISSPGADLAPLVSARGNAPPPVANLAFTLDLGPSSAAAAANAAAVRAATNNAAVIKIANSNTRAMQRRTQAGAPISTSPGAGPAPLVSGNAPPPAVAATNNAAAIKTANPTDHQPLMSFRGDAPSFTLRPGIVAVDPAPVPCSTAADDLTVGS